MLEGFAMRKCIGALSSGVLMLALQVAGRGGDPDAKALVAKAIKVSGGEAKVAPLKAGACKAKANFQEGGQQINATLDVAWNGWDQYRMTIAADFGGMAKNMLVVINGDQGWAKDTDNNQVKPAPKEAVPLITGMLYAMRMPHTLPALLDKEMKLAPLGEIKIGDRAALGVTVTHKDRKDVSLYFDKENGLPVKSEIRLTDPNGKEMTFEFMYHDYKENNGLKHCTRINVKADGKDFALELSELKAQGKVEAGLFAAPE